MNDLVISNEFVADVKKIIDEAKKATARSINTVMLAAYWNIGKRIVEEEQKGSERAEYGKVLLVSLAKKLTLAYGKGFSKSNLFSMRKFYLEYQIFQTLSGKLSWSHYLLLLGVSNKDARSFYEHECVNSNWSVRDLQRQIDSALYRRLVMSKDPEDRKAVEELATKGLTYDTPNSFIKSPMVLEFLDLPERKRKESTLEKAIVAHIEEFLMEMGRGFMFVGTQQRITVDGVHYYVDMVFYNKQMRSYVLIDLKMGKLKPEHFGKMNFYVNYYKNNINDEYDNAPIGLVLCTEEEAPVAALSVQGIDNNVYATWYSTGLPKYEELQQEVRKVVEEFKKKETIE